VTREYSFDDEHEFVHKLEELVASGVDPAEIDTVSPYPSHHAMKVLGDSPDRSKSPVKWFTLVGAVTGVSAGFGLTIYTVLHWPLMTGGKPIISIPAFIIIAFELTILLGGIFSFLGFVLLSRLPSLKGIACPELETGNKFIIQVEEEE
jgi:hypothetical protein